MRNEMGSFVAADNTKCTGCKACEMACFAVHNQGNHVGNTVGTVELPITARLYVTRAEELCMPVQCRHCDNSPCLNSCTAGAIRREREKIIIDEDKCIGCKNCMMACPFGAIELVPVYRAGKEVLLPGSTEVRKTASKCDLCVKRGIPACVNACPNQALSLVTPEAELADKRIQAALALALTNQA